MARQRDLTIIVVRGTTERTLNFRFPRYAVPTIAIALTLAIGTSIISIRSWYHTNQLAQALHQQVQAKEQTIGQQQAAIQDLTDKGRQAQPLLQELEKMHKQLQDLLKSNQSSDGKSTSQAPVQSPAASVAVESTGTNSLGLLSGRSMALASRSATAILRQRETPLQLAATASHLLDQQMQQAAQLKAELAVDQQLLQNHIAYQAHVPSGSPVSGYTVTSPFGWRPSPFGGGPDFHPGIDLAVGYGAPVYATGDGVVEVAGYYTAWYGVTVIIDHGYGLKTLYAHNQWHLAVKPGEAVKRGQLIGYVGMTGDTTGPHVHYEVHVDGQTVNPQPYL